MCRLYKGKYRDVNRCLFSIRDSDDWGKNQCVFYIVVEGHAFDHGFLLVFHWFTHGFPWGRLPQGSLQLPVASSNSSEGSKPSSAQR